MASNMSDEWYKETARKRYHSLGEIEVDLEGREIEDEFHVDFVEPVVVRNNDPTSCHGAYVLAWVWVEDSDIEET